MKLLLFALFLGSMPVARAAVRFEGEGWGYQHTEALTVKDIGLGSDEAGIERVVINFENYRQVILTGEHIALGLSLTPYAGKCIKVIPGKKFLSVDFLLNCQNRDAPAKVLAKPE